MDTYKNTQVFCRANAAHHTILKAHKEYCKKEKDKHLKFAELGLIIK